MLGPLNLPCKILDRSIFFALFGWGAVSIVLHALYINTPFVNLEYVFAQAAQSFLTAGSEKGISHYWTMQANPLGYAGISSVLHFLLGEPGGFWSYRLASLSGLVAILSAGAIFTSTSKPGLSREFHLWCALVTFSPLIWLFSGRATADVLPVGLLLLSFALVCRDGEKTLNDWLASVIFLLAILVKYHSLLMAPGFIYIFWCQNQFQFNVNWAKKCGRFFLLPFSGFLLYLWIIYWKYGFFLIPDFHIQTHKFEPSNFLNAFFLYAGFLGILLGPVAVASILSVGKYWPGKWWILFGVGLVLGLWADSFGSLGEMNYGPFDWVLNKPLIFLMKCLGAILFGFLFLDCFMEVRKNKNIFAGFLLTACLPYLLACSASRPAQRYLVFLIPLVIYYLVFYRLCDRKFHRLVLGWGTVVVFVLANIFTVNYQVAKARASENMARWLIENKLIEQTHPGKISPNSGQYFIPFTGTPKTHRVLERSGEVEKSLHSEKVVVFGRTLKSYYLE